MEVKLLTADRFVDQESGCGYRYVKSQSEYFRPHYHDYYEVFFTLDDGIIHVVNDTRQHLHTGSLVFIRPRDIHDYLHDDGQEFSFVNLTYTRRTVEELFAFLGEGFPSKALLGSPLPPAALLSERDFLHFQHRLEALCAISIDDKAGIRLHMRMLLFEIMTRYFSGFESPFGESAPEWLELLCERMKQDKNFVFGLDRMVEFSQKSREHLARCMKKYYGISATEYINNLRLIYIANMLQNSNHSVLDICYESGFQNLSWAYTLFKKKYGVSPNNFRKGGKEINGRT